MSSSSMYRREIIHISLGSTSNAISSHLLNLQGLAATSSSPSATSSSSSSSFYNHDDPNSGTSNYSLCDPNVTHTIHENMYVPRVLFVDEPKQFEYSPTTMESNSLAMLYSTSQSHHQSQLQSNQHVPTWDGSINMVDSFYTGTIANGSRNSSSGGGGEKHNTVTPNYDLLQSRFHQAASTLAYSNYSRYRITNSSSCTNQYTSISSNEERHMQWDDEEEEEEVSEDEVRYRQRRQYQQQQQWEGSTKKPLQEEMEQYWNSKLTTTTTPENDNGNENDNKHQQQQQQPLLKWRDYWMPPYPSISSFALPLPFTNPLHGGMVDTWDTYMNGCSNSSSSNPIVKHWIEDDVLDTKLRKLLESCDAVQGFHIVTQGWGLYGGVTTTLLEELQEESRSSGRFVTHIIENEDPVITNNTDDEDGGDDDDDTTHKTTSTTDNAWQSQKVEKLRQSMQSGLTLHGIATNAHVVLPLSIQNLFKNDKSLFESSSKIAMALETATLPYRLSGSSSTNSSSSSSKIGLQGYFDGLGRSSWKDSYGTIDKLNFGEYIAYLKPSNQHLFVEMDMYSQHEEDVPASATTLALLQTLSISSMVQQQQALSSAVSLNTNNILKRLRLGTSIEREQLLQQGGYNAQRSRPREVSPGAWMLNSGISANDGGGEGLMTSLSPQQQQQQQQDTSRTSHATTKMNDRQLHRHFSLASSFRPGNKNNSNNDTLTFFMEGMGVRYRPEVSMGTTVNQSIAALTTDGYGVGSYWKHLLKKKKGENRDDERVHSNTTVPVLSVIGNSTRSYSYLNSVASNMKDSLSRKYMGLHNRDVLSGTLPEAEDSSEALEYCLDVRDAYHPPEGSGLVMDSEGYYFDSNMD